MRWLLKLGHWRNSALYKAAVLGLCALELDWVQISSLPLNGTEINGTE